MSDDQIRWSSQITTSDDHIIISMILTISLILIEKISWKDKVNQIIDNKKEANLYEISSNIKLSWLN